MSVTQEEELAIYKEVALHTTKNACVDLGDVCIFHLPELGPLEFTLRDSARKMLCQGNDLAECILTARRKLQAEQDAKDAPKLREERDRFKAALERVLKVIPAINYVRCVRRIAEDALEETPHA